MQTGDWHQSGVVEKTGRVTWVNNPVFVAKKNGTIRVCIDCRPANAVTRELNWPLPRLQDLRHHLKGARWFARIDLKDAFFRIKVPEEWRHLTAFESNNQSYQFTRMPFGLKTAPAVFQRFMDHALQGLQLICFWYMDDVLVKAESASALRRNVRRVKQRLTEQGCRINEDKTEYESQGLLFGGLWVTPRGIGPNLSKVRECLAIPPPRTKKEKQSALGLVSYLRDFIPLASILTASLSTSTANTINPTEYEKEWRKLMRHVANSITTLGHWTEQEDADVYTDASGTGAAALLIQNGRIIALTSRKLTGAETRYSTTDREHLSLLMAARKYRLFLHRTEGVTRVWNDHAALMNRRLDELMPRQARWTEIINESIPNIRHVKGEKNPADFFSRWPVEAFGGHIEV